MIALLQGPGFDFGDLGSLIVFLLFVLLPVLKGLGEARQRQQEQQRGKPPAPRGERRPSGLDRWEQLLRGGSPAQPGPAERPAPAAPASRMQRRRAMARVEQPALRRPPPTAFEGIPERAPDAQRSADVPLATFDAPNWSTTEDVSEDALEVRGAADTSSEHFADGRRTAEPLASLQPAAAAASGTVPGAEIGARIAAGGLDLADWRRAVVLREVLGSPAALRGDPDLPGLH